MKKREIFIVIILITFGILYNFYESGEVELFFFDECSINPRRLLDKKHSLPFALDTARYADVKYIEIENPAGDIFVKKAVDTTVSLSSIIRVYHKNKKEAARIREKIKILTTEDNGRLSIQVESSKKFPYKRVRIEFELSAPEDVELKLHSAYGKMEVLDTGKNLSLDGRYGDILVKNVASKLNIQSRHGRISVFNISDTVDLNCRHSTVIVKDVAALRLNTSYSTISVAGVKNETGIESAAYSNLEVENSSKVGIKGRQTKIRLTNIKNGVNIENSHNSIYMKDISGDIKIETRDCRIDLEKILTDNLIIKNSHGNVVISEVSGTDLDIAVNNGDLDMKFIRVDGRINIKNKNSDISLNYPDSVNPFLNIDLEYGKIINKTPREYDIIVDQHRLSISKLEGSPGITIHSAYGDILLRNFTPKKEKTKVEPEEFVPPVEE
jgi:DUF4097 and DUF4098 domain-containing protein YvlB